MTKVKCPNDCLIEPNSLRTNGKIVEKEIEFIDGKKSERNYCCRCGTELEEVDFGFRMVRLDKIAVPDIFKESDVATEVTKGLPKDAELSDIEITDREIQLYFKSFEWEQTDLEKPVDEIEIELKDHPIEEVEE